MNSISKEMANRIVKSKSQSEIIKIFEPVMKLLDTTKNQKFSSIFINNLKKLSSTQ